MHESALSAVVPYSASCMFNVIRHRKNAVIAADRRHHTVTIQSMKTSTLNPVNKGVDQKNGIYVLYFDRIE